MRVCWISVSDQLGGSEVALVDLIRGLRAVRPSWTFDVILPGDGPLGERLAQVGASCSIVTLPRGLARVGETSAIRNHWSVSARATLALRLSAAAVALPAYERQLDRAVRSLDPDVVQSNGFKAHVLASRLSERDRPLVWHIHEYVSRRRLTRMLLRRYAPRCRAIVANSASVAADVASIFPDPPPISVVHNSVDLGTFAPAGPVLDLDRLAGLDPSPPTVRVGLVATFGRWKGHEVFIEALRRVVGATTVPVRGYIVGGPLYDTAGSQFTRDALERMIAEAGLASRVGLTGFVDAAAAMRSLDVVVHASTEPEPFGLVIAEAMACGRAVITTAHGGAAEVSDAGGDGALVAAPGDPAALAAALLRLIDDPGLRQAMGDRARAAAVERFEPRRMASQLAELYEHLTGTSVPTRVATS